jgi:hypothetical protein
MFQRLVRWWLTLFGGVLLGAGLVLHGQVAVAHHMRDEVDGTFFLWRAVGELTFVFQDDLTRAALLIRELPSDVLARSDLAAWVLMALGGVSVVAATFVRPRARSRGK